MPYFSIRTSLRFFLKQYQCNNVLEDKSISDPLKMD
uniref:Uncharacterized protein n=1 Tax=Parascaris equorum TaxID=6256 RepID=A0A914REI6_PAREQ